MVRESEKAGVTALLAALLVPSWWILPQVLAGLGLVSVLSAGCVLWLQTLQPLFAAIAVASVAYQGWLVYKRPPAMRTPRVLVIFWSSVGVCLLVAIFWILLWLRYQ